MTLGINLKKFRQDKKITQEELASKLGKSKGVISNWEKGINRPDTDAIKEICKIFNVTPNELFDWDNIKDSINLNSSESTLLKNFNKLNEEGKEEANKRIEELTQIPKYQSDYEKETNNIKKLPITEEDTERIKIIARGKGITTISKEEYERIKSTFIEVDDINDYF